MHSRLKFVTTESEHFDGLPLPSHVRKGHKQEKSSTQHAHSLCFFLILVIALTMSFQTVYLHRSLSNKNEGFVDMKLNIRTQKRPAPPPPPTPEQIPPFLAPLATTNTANGNIFIKTGDIEDMWIRDSTAQVWPFHSSHPKLVLGVLKQQSEFLLHDVYANSYKNSYRDPSSLSREEQALGRGGFVATRNYELDSGCYFLRLLHHAHTHHKIDLRPFRSTVELLVNTWTVEQRHEEQSLYLYPELPRNGLGSPTSYTGMTWSGFRPSDDACEYGYHIPSNLFAAAMLRHVSTMFPDLSEGADSLRQEITNGVNTFGTWTDQNNIKRYCYEVDGNNNCNKMDDANLPSLLSIPYFDPDTNDYDPNLWKSTYDWVWSDSNPYFFRGKAAAGIGSPHTTTPTDETEKIWPLSLITRGLVDNNPTVKLEMKLLAERTKVNGKAHESFHKDDPRFFTREDFSWPNALLIELTAEVVDDVRVSNPNDPDFCDDLTSLLLDLFPTYLFPKLPGSKFRVTKILGHGQFGAVLLANNSITGQPEAIKLVEIDSEKVSPNRVRASTKNVLN
ncbi:hypothetical protein TrLO_g10061 [Triparma laevis f. longispina]|uniref:Protein kinase domain-containing protein n=1 Tax=Triparma laevis f. longispina TaxID=1714387 RepID=A0A9W7C3J2_9STRA|nr:hypothetical protein TrLO_g10061 [Triparma laevis f. longispina]